MTQHASSLIAAQASLAEERIELTWSELARCCDADADQLLAFVNEGVLIVEGDDPQRWRFTGTTLRRVRVALRLTRDLDLNPPGAALALDLLDEIERLRVQLLRAGQAPG